MKRHSLIAGAVLLLAAAPFLFMISPASANTSGQLPSVVASGSGSSSHHAPLPIPSGSASAHPKK